MVERRDAVLVTRRLPDAVMARLREHCDVELFQGEGAMPRSQVLRRIAGKAGAVTVLTDAVDDQMLSAAGASLVVVANYAVGYDNIDVPACSRHGVLVGNTPDVLTESTADMAWALMASAARRVAEGDRLVRSGQHWIWDPGMMLGWDLHHRVLGIVGFGRIGQAVARRAKGFAMPVLYADASPAPAAVEAELGARRVPLEELLAEADFVSVHVPLTAATRHLIGAPELARMKRTATLVNTSRGPVIDEAALAEALRKGTIFAAGLDVYEREPAVPVELRELPNAVLAPHLGSATVNTRVAMGMLAVDNLLAALAGRRPPALVNPDAWEGCRARARSAAEGS